MKKIIKYIAMFVITLFLLLGILVLTAKIPQNMISENIKESTLAFNLISDVERKEEDKSYTYRHMYADAMLLNIIWCIDTETPLKSVMEAKYYSPDVAWTQEKYGGDKGNIKVFERSIDYKFDELVDENYEGNVQYLRYWHGSISILRPLLILFNLQQIYIINAIILISLAIVLAILLIKSKLYEMLLAFVVALIMCQPGVVPFCLEYYWTYLIMFVVSIIAIILEIKNKKTEGLFLLTGMVTCFLDFLSTELLTVLIPMMIILVYRYKNNSITKCSEGIKFIITSLLEWGFAYIGMWIAKWIIASIVLNVNAFDYVTERALERLDINIIHGSLLDVISQNVFALFPLNSEIGIKIVSVILISIIPIEIILIRKKEVKSLWISGLLFIIASIPYLRYIALANHSFLHYFFTFRAQLVSIIAIILAIIYSWDTNRLKNIIKRVKQNGIHNTNTMLK